MKISEIQAGKKLILEVQQKDRKPFSGQNVLMIPNELTLHQSDIRGEIFLCHEQNEWEIKGINQDNQNKLEDLIERNLPRLCCLIAKKPKNNTPEILTIQIHEFPLFLFVDQLQIGLDDKIIDEIRDQHIRRQDPVDKIIDWLNNKILILHNNQPEKRALLQAGTTLKNELESSFQLWGKDIVINIKRTVDNKFIIDRIQKSRQPKNINEKRPLILLKGDISFCDISIAGSLRSEFQTELDQIVKNSDSYLKLWQEYNKIEQEIIWKKAKEFRCLKYINQRLLNNGNFRFQLQDNQQLKIQLQLLKENPNFSLEASEKAPNLSEEEEADSLSKNDKTFFGEVVEINLNQLTIDINSSDKELTPPQKGYLFISLIGDRTRLKRRAKAESLIRLAQNPMPQLGLLLENIPVPIKRIGRKKPLSSQVKKLFNGLPTSRQEEAIKVALNTPDIALIQGPPGTGKTKVITAIQARLAEEAEDLKRSVNHRILLTSYQHDAVENAAEKTVLFQLPAVRVGGRKQKNDQIDNVDRWRRQRIQTLKGKLANITELPGITSLKRIRNLMAIYQLTPGTREETGQLLEEIYELTKDSIRQELADHLFELKYNFQQKTSNFTQENSGDLELVIKAVQGIRKTAATFSDDGNITANKALKRLKSLNILTKEEANLLVEAADWIEESPPPFLEQLANLQQELLTRLMPTETQPVTTPVTDPQIMSLLEQVKLSFEDNIKQTPKGIEVVLFEYLDDLENDPEAVAQTIRKYTVVLAATCQQAAGGAMRMATENENHVFETVIVDEAARANPLDLFIPMSKAEKRIILVGDHRQLPHILEEDVERKLTKSSEKTQDILKKSLFERLFNQLKELEKKDGVKRTVTLDTQYRMHPILGDFVSKNFYECHGEPTLKSGRLETDFSHDLPGYENIIATWINVPFELGGETKNKSKSRNIEAKIIAKELKKLIEHNQNLTFGIIAFYAAQVTEIWEELEKIGIAERSEDGVFQVANQWKETRNSEDKIVERLRIGTVDAFQGKEFDIVFLSLTRSNNIKVINEEMYRQKYGFLMLENRLCVAMSRQQRLLIIVGDLDMIKHDSAPQAIPQLVNFYQLCQTQNGKIYHCK